MVKIVGNLKQIYKALTSWLAVDSPNGKPPHEIPRVPTRAHPFAQQENAPVCQRNDDNGEEKDVRRSKHDRSLLPCNREQIVVNVIQNSTFEIRCRAAL